MIKRYSTSILGAFTITFFLFLGMYFLIAPEKADKPEIKGHGPIVLGKIREPLRPDTKIRQPDKIKNTIEKMDLPKLARKDKTSTTIEIGGNIPLMPTDRITPRNIGLANGDIQPLRKFAPAYPSRQVSQGIEGYVIVKFTVNKMGAVENIIIVESTNRAFERPSIRAVAKYKYKPRIIDGTSVEVRDVMEKISFELEDS